MKNITVIVCNNGLGHIKRALWLLRLFYKKYPGKIKADIFVNTDKLKYFPVIINNFKKKHKVNFFHIASENEEYEKEFLSKYRNYLRRADYVWSDNLVFPLKLRKEVFLTGSFLWCDVIRNAKSIKEEDILLKRRPLMMACKYFATPKVKAFTRFEGVGIYNYFPFCIPHDFSYKVLLSCGKSKRANIFFERNIASLKSELKNLPSNIEVYIEPEYYRHFNFANNIKRATFTEKMFLNISAAAIRPGIGTICDVLSKGGRIFSFFEENALEIRYNANILIKMGVGEKSTSIKKALNRAVSYLFNKKSQREHFKSLKKIDFHGLDQTVVKIREVLN